MNQSILKLCLVTNQGTQTLDKYLSFLDLAIQGGITSVQLRDKSSSLETLYTTASAIKQFLIKYKIPLIINDYLDIAVAIDADGIHLGQNDGDPIKARNILGPEKIIGLSIESYADLYAANNFDCIDYIAASAVFPSKNKLDCKKIWGLDGLKEISQRTKHFVVAIGGINSSNASEVTLHGADGLAVIGALHDYSNPKKATQELVQEIERGRSYVQRN